MSEQNQSIYENSDYPSRQNPFHKGEPDGPKKGDHHRRDTIFKVLGTLLLIGLCTGAIMCCFLAVYIKTVIFPYADLSLDDFVVGENSIMLYQDKKTGEYKELVTLLSPTKSTWVSHDEIPEDLINAAVAIEDQRFWEHPGVDWRRTGRAVLDMFMGNDISGGSTITQQLIKNMTDYNETTVKRKITEIVRAIRFTKNYSKEDTITWYLNIIPLGSGCEGVGSASFEYFGKPVSELSLAECASLISITNNPSRYSPYSDSRSKTKEGELWDAKQWNKWRQEKVLGKMLELGYITQEEHDEAVAEELVFVRSEDEPASKTVYSWYEETVIADLKRDLKEKLEWSDNRINQVLAQGGLRIYTCLDPEVQAVAEKVYTNRANLNYKSANGNPMQSSITIIDNTTGDVAAIVGQFGEKDRNLLKNYANTAQRQPGSSIKPLTVYAPALEMGLISPITVFDDYPYKVLNDKPWPSNSGTSRYKGRTTVREGLTHSVNTLAVRILADEVTPKASFRFAEERFKLDLVDSMKVGDEVKSDLDVAPLSMGGLTTGVCTRDMAEAYATFPNGGVYTQSRTYSKVTMMVDGEEVLLLENPPVQESVLKESTAYYINSMLRDVVQRGTARGHGVNGVTSAGKTGTTSMNYDRWFVGYTPYYTAAVWTGYDKENEQMKTKGNPSLLLWEKVMDEVHRGMKNKSFPTPEGLVSVRYCADSGLLATDYCSMDPRGSRIESDKVFREDVPNGSYCKVHKASGVVKVCMDSPILDSKGQPTGMYHLAGPHCPANRIKQVCLPEFDRKQVGGVYANDQIFTKSAVTAQGPCTVHTGVQQPVEPEVPAVEPETPEETTKPVEPEQPAQTEGGEQAPEEETEELEELGRSLSEALENWKNSMKKAG